MTSRSDALREVTVNGVRYFQAQDVERWHRNWSNLTEHADALEEENARLREFIEHTASEYGERMPSQWKAHAKVVLLGE